MRTVKRTMSNWIQVRYEKPSKYLRSFRYNLNQWAGWNYDGDRLYSGFNVNAHAMFKNNWGTGVGGNLNPQPFDDLWQQGREGVIDRGTFDFNRDFGGVFDAPARNVFLLKWSYWLNP